MQPWLTADGKLNLWPVVRNGLAEGLVLWLSTIPYHVDGDWNDSQPIYRQLRDRVVAMILDRVLQEGDPLPSVRTVAAEYRVNPITVLKAYQELVGEGLVHQRRGRGMFVNTGAYALLLRAERVRFLQEQWPRVHATIQRLGLSAADLLDAAAVAEGQRSNDEKEE